MAESAGTAAQPEVEPIELESRRWLDAIEAQVGPLSLFDAHTHIGRNDPDGYRQEPAQLLASMEWAGARAVTFPMHEPGGYRAANDEAMRAAAGSAGRLACFCRVDPRDDALTEARRCLDATALGIKLHPRAEGFAMSEPAVEQLVALADERRVPMLIHAGRGIPALGHDTARLAERYPGARLILAHAAVSDIAWLWRLMPDHPNLFVDTSWWNPADLLAVFALVPPGQVLWASDSPYGLPVHSAAFQLRFALVAGLDKAQLDSIVGGQLERLLSGEEPLDAGPPPGPTGPLDPGMERVCSHLLTAMGRAFGEAETTESVALAELACEDHGEHARAAAAIRYLIEEARRHEGSTAPGRRFPRSLQFLMLALAVARTPDIALPDSF
jgi:predicted TIM-barrel fold metal-dependent hydrolase